MAKYRSPFHSGEVAVTQTYHSGSNNTAVDLSRTTGTAVYAIANGVIQTVSPSYGSYLTLKVDNSDHTLFYVHIYNFLVKSGDRVTIGQKIAEIAPSTVNGGNPPHLHLGLQTGKYIMDYFDRNITFVAGFAWGSANNLAIRNAWFNGGSVFDWSKHKDLSYESNTMKIGDNVELSADTNLRVGSGTSYNVKTVVVKGAVGNIIGGSRNADGYEWWDVKFTNDQGWMANPLGTRLVKTTKQITQTDGKLPTPPTTPPVAPEPTECEKQITMLNGQISALESKLEAQGVQLEALKQEKVVLLKNIEKIEMDAKIREQKLEGEVLEWKEMYTTCKADLENSKENFVKKILDAIKKWLDSTVG